MICILSDQFNAMCSYVFCIFLMLNVCYAMVAIESAVVSVGVFVHLQRYSPK